MFDGVQSGHMSAQLKASAKCWLCWVACRAVSSVAGVLRTDGRMTENISERCRPTTVALRYNSLESQQWMDAKEAIEDGPGSHLEEGAVVSMLCHALMVSPQGRCRANTATSSTVASVLPSVCVCVCVCVRACVAGAVCMC